MRRESIPENLPYVPLVSTGHNQHLTEEEHPLAAQPQRCCPRVSPPNQLPAHMQSMSLITQSASRSHTVHASLPTTASRPPADL